MYGASAARRHLSGLHQPGAARLAAGVGVALDVRRVRGAGLLRRHHLDDHFGGDHRLQPEQRPADRPARPRPGDGPQRGADGGGAVRLFDRERILDALPVGGALRPRGGQRGRGPQQLRRPALRQPAHELAALHVGGGHPGGAQPHQLCAVRRAGVAGRLPGHLADAAGPDGGAGVQPAAVEEKRRRKRSRARP